MASPENKSAAKGNSCLEEFLPQFSATLPGKTRLTTDFSNGTPARSEARAEQIQTSRFDVIPMPIDKIRRAINPVQSIQVARPKKLTPAELHRLYAGTWVPQHRYLAPSLTAALESPEIAPHPAKWLAGIPGVNLSSVVNAWLNTNRSTDFEQLRCIGLNPNTRQLSSMIVVRRGIGYSGDLSTTGSREYVAFWVDWGSGFQYEGTASVTVYDFSGVPPAGMEYRVSLPGDFLSRAQRGGEVAKTVKVRAVLSWNTPPSTTDPNAPVVWGNCLESRIPIPSGQAARAGNRVPCLAAAGAMDVDQIGANGRIIHTVVKWLPQSRRSSLFEADSVCSPYRRKGFLYD